MVIPPGSVVYIPGVGVNLSCSDLIVQGTLALGSAHLQGADTVNIGTGGALNGGTGTITLNGNWSNGGQFSAHQSNVVVGDACANPISTFTGNTTFFNLTLTSTTGKAFVVPPGTVLTVLGTLSIQGTAVNPVSVSGGGTIQLSHNASLINNHGSIGPTVTVQRLPVQSIPVIGIPGLLFMAIAVILIARRRLSAFH
jgi:hypothetical protein